MDKSDTAAGYPDRRAIVEHLVADHGFERGWAEPSVHEHDHSDSDSKADMPRPHTHDRDEPVPFVNDEVGSLPGYVAGWCGHKVAGLEWKAGFRVCERCAAEHGREGTKPVSPMVRYL